MEGPDPRPAPLTGSDAEERPDWAEIEPPEWDEPDEPADVDDVPEPVTDAVAEPVAEPVTEPVTEPVVAEPVIEPIADPVQEPVAEPVASDEPTVVSPPVEPSSSLFLPVALGLALLVLLGAVGWLVMDTRDTRSRDDARQAALQAARQQAVNLTTISYETADADLGRIIASATGTLKTQFEGQRAQFPAVLARDKSVSVGTVLAAGVASQSAGTVEALVAVDAAVSNAETAKAAGRPLVKHYRMDMKLVLVGGRWLVSQVAFAGLPQ